MSPVIIPCRLPLGQLAALFLCAWAGPIWGQISFRENYADKVIGVRDFGETYYEQLETGKFTIRFRFQMPGPVVWEATTPLEIVVGDWTYRGFLGDDPRFQAGATKVNIPLEGGKLRLALGKEGAVTGAVRAKTGYNARFDIYENSPAAGFLAGEIISFVATDGVELAFSLSIGEEAWQATATPLLTGVATVKTVTRGPREFAEVFDLASVAISAAGMVTVSETASDPKRR